MGRGAINPGIIFTDRDNGVQKYWLVDWQKQQIEIYRRDHAVLTLIATLFVSDELTCPLLPSFSCTVVQIFTFNRDSSPTITVLRLVVRR